MKTFFNNLFAIFTQQKSMSKHTKIMFVVTILLATLFGLVLPLWATILITSLMMVLCEIAFAFIPTKQIKILFFKLNVFDFENWQYDLIDETFDQHNEIVKNDFFNICSGLIIYMIIFGISMARHALQLW